MTLLIPRKADLTFEELQQAYSEHIKLAAPILREYGAMFNAVVLPSKPTCGGRADVALQNSNTISQVASKTLLQPRGCEI